MSALIVIPARYGSTRYDGKPLVELRGANGEVKTLIQRTWEAAQAAAADIEATVVIATDDDRIMAAAQAFGAECLLTPADCRNGTERCAAAARQLSARQVFDFIVNVQGDAPLTPPSFIHRLLDALRSDTHIRVATPVLRCDDQTLTALRADRTAGRVGGTTVVMRSNGHAIYFSKEVIPHGPEAVTVAAPVFHHVGVYAYRPDALRQYRDWPQGPLETAEGLEQLRFIEVGCPVHCVEVAAEGRKFWEVNNPSDVPIVEQALRDAGID